MAGEGSTSSSTSHTLTHAPGIMSLAAAAASSSTDVSAMAALLDTIRPPNRHVFLQPSPSIPSASLQLAKATLDSFAGQVSDEQQQQLREAKKRKREGGLDRSEVLKIRKLHVDGFETGQVWQQAKRIISSALSQSNEVLRELEENNEIETELATKTNGVDGDAKMLEFDEDGFEIGSDDEDSSDIDEELASGSEEGSDESESGEEGSDELEGKELEDEDLEEEDDLSEGSEGDLNAPAEEFVEDPNGLNDGFFSIDDFNKQTQWFEEQDAKADPYTDQVSDDEEVDWHTDPMSASNPTKQASKSKGAEEELAEVPFDEDEEDDDDEEAGPTFGDMKLDAPEGESEDEFGGDLEDGLDGGLDLTANDIFYKDFFAPPPRKVKKGDKPRKRAEPPRAELDDRDVERAMADVRRDLFEDLSERSDSEDALSDVSAGDPRSRRSAHERKQAKLAEEIRRLESELVAKRAWTLSGEAAAVDRPMNSLLEEDLEFEHIGKPVPVITEEVSEDMEAMIKRRIIAGEFDELIRRRPNADVPTDTRRGLIELDDSKAQKSLAEIYEEEHVKNANPDTYVSKADEKLRKEEKEIEQMWKELSAKLDALSSWHYKPKPAAPSLTVVADVATISMEDAQPTTAQGVSGGESMIAPQEVYNPGKDTAEKGEVVAKSGLPVAKQEMSREDKVRRRRREKERQKKSGDQSQPISKKAQEKKDTMADLKKGGVKVINRKGEVLDMEGNKAQAAKAVGSGSYKL